MGRTALSGNIAIWMRALCLDVEGRHVGSPGNQKAADFFEQTLTSFGLQPESTRFDCLDWEGGEVLLKVDDRTFPAWAGPYSLPCDARAELIAASSLDELKQKDLSGKLLLLHGEVAKEQVMPKGFAFYNPEHHQQIIAALERANPAGIIAATGKNPELAGGLYPFPLFEDGDFDIPSVYMKDVDGEMLLEHVGSTARLRFESRRIPSVGRNVLVRIPGSSGEKIVVCAHIDTKKGTSGALDDASGITVLLALAELLRNESARYTTEIVALNGEDYYSAPGQMAYLADNHGFMDQVYLAINLDGAGYRGVRTAVSLYGAPDNVQSTVRNLIRANDRFIEGGPWYQGDHSIFIQHGRPAMAITSENIEWLSQAITHTAGDNIDQVDFVMLADIALMLHECILRLGEGQSAPSQTMVRAGDPWAGG